jgi:acylglycerol lipase
MTEAVIRTFTSSDGYLHHFRHWPHSNPRGIIVATHGIQSHSGWYLNSSSQLVAAGYSVYFADRRGSGMNTEKRGHADHGMRLVNDLRQLLETARHDYAGKTPPVTLMGVSWGGKIAAAVAAVAPSEIDQLALLYPGLSPQIHPTSLQKLQLRLAEFFDARFHEVSIPLNDARLFTENPDWQAFIRSDSLALHTVTTGFLNSGRHLAEILRSGSPTITHPVLLMLAGHDRIIHNEMTRRLVCSFASPRLLIRTWPEACHTLEFEADRETIFSEVIDWLALNE